MKTKKILFAAFALAACCVNAQVKKMEFFRDGTVAKRMSVSAVDSMNFTTDDDGRVLQLFANSATTPKKIKTSQIDSITFKEQGLPSNLHMGIIGFNSSLTTKAIAPLGSDNKTEFTNFVSNLTSQNGTVLYYAVDNALDKMFAAELPTDLVNVSMITFTDGLDQGSHMLNGTYEGDDDTYSSALSNRIKSAKIQDIPVTAYSIGIRGNDVTNTTLFQQNLQRLATGSNYVTEVTNMSEVNTKFQEIADEIYSQSTETKTTVTLKIPGQPNGTKVRFTFDNLSDAANSNLYIEGDFRFSDKSLQNVIYQGFTSSTGDVAVGTVDGIFVTYKFENIKLTSGAALSMNYVKQWAYVTGSNLWQVNSEFTKDGNTSSTTTTTRKSALIMLVLDCSSSLGSQFSTMKTNANNFINTLANNIGATQKEEVDNDSYSDTFTANGVTFDMVGVAGGTTTLGSTNVTLRGFSIGQTEVTQGLWLAVMGLHKSTQDYGSGSNYPEYNVSWDDIVGTGGTTGYTINSVAYKTDGFCYKLSQLVGGGAKFCLPTAAQWEYAAKGGQQTHNYTYSGSNTIGDVAWYSSNSGYSTQPVGTKQANELGIYDMSGNVLEWCSDWYSSTYPYSANNPVGPTSGSTRVVRGGSWGNNAGDCTVACRVGYYSNDRYSGFGSLGFRVALVP